MEAVPKLPMISFELKQSTEPTSFSNLKRYIAECYHEDPESYTTEVHALTTLRNIAIRPANDVTGCNNMKRYFCQLQSLQSRFPNMADRQLFSFSWRDAYSNVTTQSPDVRFEMAIIFYNIGALHSKLGAEEDRSTENGMKVACTHFQCAAWAFTQLKDAYPHATSADLSSELLVFMVQVCFAQAQECILEKSLLDNRKSAIVAKVTAQIISYYNSALVALISGGEDGSITEITGGKVFKDWKRYVSFKIDYLSCILYLYQGQQAEEQKKMGERVTLFQAAFDKFELAKKDSKGLHEIDRVNEALAFVGGIVEVKRKNAKNENEFIYHEEVPEMVTIAAVQGANLVNGIGFSINDPDIAQEDIFHRLVPMKAHEASSLYSEEKAEILRRIGHMVDERDEELVKFMSSLNTDPLSYDCKSTKLPQGLVDRCASLNAKPNAIPDLVKSMSNLAETCLEVESMLHEIKELLGEEEIQEKSYQKQMGSRPTGHIAELNREYTKYNEAHIKAGESNETLRKAMELHVNNLKTLAQPLSNIQKLMPVCESQTNEDSINELNGLLSKVNEMKTQRSQLVATLRENITNDDITSQVIVWGDNKLKDLFKQELAKHDKTVALIEQNLKAQHNILKALTTCYAKCAITIKMQVDIKHSQENFFAALISSFDVYEDLLAKSLKGLEFYKKLQGNIQKLLTRIRAARDVQDEERQQRLKSNVNASAAAPSKSSGPKLKDYLKAGGGIVRPVDDPPGYVPTVRPNPLGSETTTTSTCVTSTAGYYSGANQYTYSAQDLYQSYQNQSKALGYTNPLYQNSVPPPTPNLAQDTQMTYPNAATSGYDYPPYQSPQGVAPIYNTPTYSSNSQMDGNQQMYASYNQPQVSQQSNQPANLPQQQSQYPPQQSDQQISQLASSMGSMQVNYYPQSNQSYIPQQYPQQQTFQQPSSPSPAYGATSSSYGQQAASSVSTYAQQSYGQPTSYNQPVYGQSSINIYGQTDQQAAFVASYDQAPPPYEPPQSSQYGQTSVSGQSGSSYGQTSSVPSYGQLYNSTSDPPQYNNSTSGQTSLVYNQPTSVYGQSTPAPVTTTAAPSPYANQTTHPGYSETQQPPKYTYDYQTNQYVYQQPDTQAAMPTYPQQNIQSHSEYTPQSVVYSSYQADNSSCSLYTNAGVFATDTTTNQTGIQSHSQQQQYQQYQSIGSQPSEQYYNIPYGYASSDSSTANAATVTQYTPANPVTYVHSNSGGGGSVTGIQPQETPSNPQNPQSSVQQTDQPVNPQPIPALPKPKTSSNLDLLSGIDFGEMPLAALPLQPITAVSADQKSDISVPLEPKKAASVPPEIVPIKVDIDSSPKTFPTDRKSSVDQLSPCSDISSLDQNFDWESASMKNEDVKSELSESIASKPKDPFDDAKLLKLFHKEVEQYEKFIENSNVKTLNGTTPLDSKWKELQDLLVKDESKRNTSIAKLFPEKNRSIDSIPYDHARVPLPTTTDDYINAAFVNDLGPRCPAMIIAQTPMPNTTQDFWYMIWSQKVKMVVCLHTPTEILDPFWSNDSEKDVSFGDFTVSLQKQFDLSHCIERILRVSLHGNDAVLTVSLVQIKAWPKNSSTNILGVAQNIITSRQQQQSGLKASVLLSCLTGCERSGLVAMAIVAILATQQPRPALINVVDVWYRICSQRKGALRDVCNLQLSMQIVLGNGHAVLNKRGIFTSYQMKTTQVETRIEKEEAKDPFSDLDPLWQMKQAKK